MNVVVVFTAYRPGSIIFEWGNYTARIAGSVPTCDELLEIRDGIEDTYGVHSVRIVNIIPLAD